VLLPTVTVVVVEAVVQHMDLQVEHMVLVVEEHLLV
jgi:hypothetical protein